MSIVKKKAIILPAVFILALIIGMLIAPEKAPAAEEGSTMNAASLPVLCMSLGDRQINPLYGYTEEMDAAGFADSVFPFTDALTAKVTLLGGTARPKSVSYEIRDEQGTRLIERGTATAFDGSRGEYSFSFSLQDLYAEETYYRLKFTVSMNDGSANYYTRIRKVDGETLKALTEYAGAFHDAMFDKSAASAYSAKLEPNDQADRNTLAFVDIHCAADQVSWGSSGAVPASDAWLTIQALHGDYGYFRFDYLASADAGGAEAVTFCCRETMTLQKNKKAMYLLEYERHAAQLWAPSEDTVSAKGFLLGLQEDGSVQMMRGGDYTAFAVNGELYCYAAKEQKLTRVFSFRKHGEHELRTFRSDDSIRIMEVTEAGNIDFTVSGYMNGGIREGMSGAVYYTWQAENGTLKENMAIASDKAPALVKEDAAKLFMRGNGHFLYFCMDRQIIAMDITSGETAILVDRGEFGSLVLNENGTAFAWQPGSDQKAPGSIHVMDLVSGMNRSLEAAEGEFIRTLGYIREDLIIGRGRTADAPLNDGEEGRSPLSGLEILSEELESITRYSYPGIYLSGIEQDKEKIIVHRYAVKNDGKYLEEADDVLLRGDSEVKPSADAVSSYTHDTLRRLTMIAMNKLPSYLRLTTENTSEVIEGRKLTLPDGAAGAPDVCYAYGRGRLIAVTKTPGEAIALSAPDYGYVIDARDGRVIWAWSVKKEKAELSSGAIRTDLERHMDLTGAAYRNLLYYIDSGIPVRWISQDGGERWLIGYEWQRGILYDPVTQETMRMAQEELEQAILRNDNYLWFYTD